MPVFDDCIGRVDDSAIQIETMCRSAVSITNSICVESVETGLYSIPRGKYFLNGFPTSEEQEQCDSKTTYSKPANVCVSGWPVKASSGSGAVMMLSLIKDC